MSGRNFYNRELMDIVLNGLLSGIVLAFLIGPVFFTILQTSIEHGFRHGALVAIGVSLSDSIYISLCYLGLSGLAQSKGFSTWLAYAGGMILIGFGLYYIVIKSRKLGVMHIEHIQARSPWRYVMKGFVINGLSPLVLIFWVGTMGVATTEFHYVKDSELLTYFGMIVLTVFTTDLIKAKLADKLRVWLTTKIIKRMNFVLGAVLLIFGIRLLIFGEASMY